MPPGDRSSSGISVFFGAPISASKHQGGMQKRPSARSSKLVEGVGSGGRFDSELIQCADDIDEQLHKKSLPVSHPGTATTGSADQLEHWSNSGCSSDSVQCKDQAAHLGHFAVD
jgi:hypothetical protein